MTGKAPKMVATFSGKGGCLPRWLQTHRKTGVVPLLLSVTMLALLALTASSARASTSYVDGISDQHLYNWESGISSLFSNAWVGSPPSHIKLARYVVQWNVIGGGGYSNEESNFRAWYERAGQLGLIREIALADFTGANEPSSSEYRAELEKILTAFSGITYVEAWNEPNHHSSAVKFYVKAVAAAHYMNAAYSVCQAHGCTAIAGDFLDESNMSEYEAEYISGSNLTPKDPPNWGIHPYAAVDTEKASTVEAFRSGLPGKGSENISFTEVGAYYCKKGESVSGGENASHEAYQAKHASYLVNTLIPHTTNLEHVFYYEFAFEGAKRINCGNVEDTELYAPPSEGQPDQPRSAASVIFGPEGPPAASTGEAVGITTTQAQLRGNVDPNGIDDTKYYFQYGTNTEYTSGSTILDDAGQSLNWENETTPVSGLQPDTTYHYRIVATSAAGTLPGNDSAFITPGPPVAITGSATNMQETQATLGGEVNPLGFGDAEYYFEYGETAAYGIVAPIPHGDAGSGTSNIVESVNVAKLEPGVTYHFRIMARNSWAIGEGKDETFTTPQAYQYIAFRGSNNAIWQWWWTPTNGWNLSQLGGTAEGDPSMAVAREGNGYQYIAFRGSNNAIWQWWWTPTNGWNLSQLGGTAASNPSMAVAPNGDQDIAFVGSNGAIWQWWWTPTNGWNLSQLGGSAVGDPSMVVASNGYQYITFRGSNGTIWQWWWTPTNGWNLSELGGAAVGDPSMAIARDGSGYQYIAFRGTNNAIWQWWWTPTSGWNLSQLGGATSGSPSMAVARNGYQDISFVGTNGAVWQWWWTPTNGWNLSQLGGAASGNTSMAVAPNGYQDVAFTGTNGSVWEWWWTPTNSWNLSQLGGAAASDPSMALMSGL